MACSITIRILEDKNVKQMNKALLSMYADRLVPASDIFTMAEHLYAKMFLLLAVEREVEWHQDTMLALKKRLITHTHAIDTLLEKYEQTYLVDREKAFLKGFKHELTNYKERESELLAADINQLLKVVAHVQKAKAALKAAINALSEVEKIQTTVGKELMADVQFVVKGTRFFSALQLILSIIIGIMVVALVLESKSMIKSNIPFNLN
ncbi:hypothetical protein GCM10023231_42360 [Olivibacter ginsenosidimutans]|uniref:Chemotaxis methyl-accepting receptor HlyB-like 4HB MCP domain-containing protein n=2 Tax=Olivibacter ginsenosidimutans TaxID=1176537 RepID=A0ABP9CGP7_9SPHI